MATPAKRTRPEASQQSQLPLPSNQQAPAPTQVNTTPAHRNLTPILSHVSGQSYAPNSHTGFPVTNPRNWQPQASTVGSSTQNGIQMQGNRAKFYVDDIEGNNADLHNLWMTKNSADCTIQCSDGVLGAHKFLLSLKCTVFEHHFKGNPQCTAVLEADYSVRTMDLLLQYIYTGRVALQQDGPELEQATELVKAAIKYKMERLQHFCLDGLISNINSANIGELLKFSFLNKNILPKYFHLRLQNFIFQNRIELGALDGFNRVCDVFPEAFRFIMLGNFASN